MIVTFGIGAISSRNILTVCLVVPSAGKVSSRRVDCAQEVFRFDLDPHRPSSGGSYPLTEQAARDPVAIRALSIHTSRYV